MARVWTCSQKQQGSGKDHSLGKHESGPGALEEGKAMGRRGALRAAGPLPAPIQQGASSTGPGLRTKPHGEGQGLTVPRASKLWAQSPGKAWPGTLSEGLCGPLGSCPGQCRELARVV